MLIGQMVLFNYNTNKNNLKGLKILLNYQN